MLKCPIPTCDTPLAVHEVRGCLSEETELLGRYEKFGLQRYLEKGGDNIFFCPGKRFGLQRYLEKGGDNIFFCPGKTCEFAMDAGPPPERPEEFACPSCTFKSCLKCKKSWHPKISCEMHAQSLELEGGDKGFLKYVQKMQTLHIFISCEMHAQSLELEGEDKGFLKYVQKKKMKTSISCEMHAQSLELEGEDKGFLKYVQKMQTSINYISLYRISCEMHAQSLELEGEDKGFLKYVQKKKMKKCPSCKMWVEKSDGCNAMLCRGRG
ncbi:hypothetical protein T484DRAFT_1846961 [Baffinella frigidus]|nr:hypothetical protein T484DRAFT_1846961 [Cryptophyta sp. CCMP2293]